MNTVEEFERAQMKWYKLRHGGLLRDILESEVSHSFENW